MRSQAAKAIGYMGPKAAEATPDLVQLMAHGADAREAMRALMEIGDAAVPHLEALLDGAEELRRAAAEALGLINPESK